MENQAPEIEFIAFDLETTGLDARFDRIVEIGAVRFGRDGEVLDRFDQRVNPGCRMPLAALAVHGISDSEVASAPVIREVLPGFLAFLGNSRTTEWCAQRQLRCGLPGTGTTQSRSSSSRSSSQ